MLKNYATSAAFSLPVFTILFLFPLVSTTFADTRICSPVSLKSTESSVTINDAKTKDGSILRGMCNTCYNHGPIIFNNEMYIVADEWSKESMEKPRETPYDVPNQTKESGIYKKQRNLFTLVTSDKQATVTSILGTTQSKIYYMSFFESQNLIEIYSIDSNGQLLNLNKIENVGLAENYILEDGGMYSLFQFEHANKYFFVARDLSLNDKTLGFIVYSFDPGTGETEKIYSTKGRFLTKMLGGEIYIETELSDVLEYWKYSTTGELSKITSEEYEKISKSNVEESSKEKLKSPDDQWEFQVLNNGSSPAIIFGRANSKNDYYKLATIITEYEICEGNDYPSGGNITQVKKFDKQIFVSVVVPLGNNLISDLKLIDIPDTAYSRTYTASELDTMEKIGFPTPIERPTQSITPEVQEEEVATPTEVTKTNVSVINTFANLDTSLMALILGISGGFIAIAGTIIIIYRRRQIV